MRALKLMALAAAAASCVPPRVSNAQAPRVPGDQWLTKPVDDRTFASFKAFYQYDASLPLDVKVLDTDSSTGIVNQHLTFQSTAGVRVTARMYSQVGSAGVGPGLILVHGGSLPGKDGAEPRFLGDFFARAGFRVLAIDLLYYGERNTGLLTTFADAEKHDNLYNQKATYLAFVMQTIKDVGRSFDLLASAGADPKRIGYLGGSRGGVLGAIAGGADKRIAAVALVHPGHFDYLEKDHEAAACPANYIGRIAPRPLFIINGDADMIMLKHESALPLQRLAREPKEIVWLTSGHAFPRDEMPRLASWFHAKMR